jgi:Protein of unknown function (DUF1549)/Protein of unknown function (DUF1553)
MTRSAWRATLALALLGLFSARLLSEEKPPLHEQIDRLVEAAAVGPLAPICSDADFVRRAYLDFTGVIPTADEARAFVADSSPAKRQRLIDDLVARAAFVRHMTITLDVLLMERKAEKAVKQPEWEAYLYKSLASDKPLDQLFRELIAADGADEPLRPAARFVLDRDAEPNLVTRDIGRLVFGMDLQCCQCHDHPLIDDYYQDDYYGLFAFVHRTSMFTDAKSKQISLTEKADGEASFKSVFTGASSDKAQPRLPKGAVLFIEPAFDKGEEYRVKPDKTVRGVPKFSRRAALAEMIPASHEFSRNLANRLWTHLLGRGIVHPVDFHYTGNPPANPRLLTLLADELAAGGFKLRPLLREMALSRTYQRSCDAPRPDVVNFADIAARLDGLKREKESQQQRIKPLEEALAVAKAEFKSVRADETRIATELAKHEKAFADARQVMEKAATQQQAASESARKAATQSQAVSEAEAKLAAAAAALPDDKTLAEALRKVQALAGELAAAVTAAEKLTDQRMVELKTATGLVKEAEAAFAMATAARPSIDQLRELERAELAAEHKLADTRFVVAATDKQIALAQSILDYSALAKTDPVKAEAAWNSIVERWTIAGQVAPLKPLTPEQFAASAMQATGTFAPELASINAKLDKSPPDMLKNAADADKPRLRENAVQLELLNQLRGTFREFVRQYGGEVGQEFQATVNQALFFGNGTIVDGWLKPGGENLVARLAKLDDMDQLADEMAWAVYSRPATETEKQGAKTYLKNRGDKPAAIGEMAWALLSATEFRFNH